MAASRRNPGLIWLHNDSGDGPFVYGVTPKGKTKAVYRVRGASSRDWEDMAAGPGPNGRGSYLYLGDIGDNNRRRADCAVYRVAEPSLLPGSPGSRKKPRLAPEPVVHRLFSYPEGPHDAEALMVHPKSGALYIVTKEDNGLAGVYKFPPETQGRKSLLIRVGQVKIPDEMHLFPNLVTGGDISPDGRKVVLRTYAALYELHLPTGTRDFDAIWRTPLVAIPSPQMAQTEAVCYSADGRSLLTTSEKVPTPLYEVKSR